MWRKKSLLNPRASRTGAKLWRKATVHGRRMEEDAWGGRTI